MSKELQIKALKNGIVIDHIPTDKLFSIVELLNLKEYQENIIIATNLKSSLLGKKALIKIEEKELKEKELGEISLLTPNVTINIIKNYEVIKKIKLEIPEEIIAIIKCPNSKCISNYENIDSKYIKEEDKYRCYYCERKILLNEIEFKNI